MLINLQDPNIAADLIINGMLHQVDVSDVQVRTLHSFYQETIQSAALTKHSGLLKSIQPNFDKVDRRIKEHVDAGEELSLRQFIDFTGDQIAVYLHQDGVDDNTWSAVVSALSQVDEMVGVVEFGPSYTFGSKKPPVNKIKTTDDTVFV